MRFVGLLLVLLTGGFAGIRCSVRLRKHTEQLQLLQGMLTDLAAMLRYQSPTVWELTATLCTQPKYQSLSFLHLSNTGEERFSAVWTDAVMRDKTLAPEEQALLRELGETLGMTDTAGQLAALELFSQRSERLLTDARNTYITKGRLYRTLGLLGGAAAAVLLA